MTPELTVLALAALVQVAQIVLMTVTANMELSPRKTLGPRDDSSFLDGLSPRTGRIIRAMDNHYDALVLFGIAVALVTLSDQSTGFTAACAWVYLIARVLYVAAYAFGWVPWRSVIWMIGLGATTLMIIAALI